jgi:xylulokinase
VEPERGQLGIYDNLYKVFNELYPSLQVFLSLSAGVNSEADEQMAGDNKITI